MAIEKRLIDANKLAEAVSGIGKDIKRPRAVELMCICLIADAPTVDAVEVVHAQWLYDSGSGKHFCSACDEYALSFKKDTLYGGELYEVCLTDYCPNCGADMR